jgi:putative tricarboxylic transport membrane protein
VIDGLIQAAGEMLAWPGLLFVLIGVVCGIAVGILPGVGGAGATALLIPISYSMESAHAIGFLMAVALSSGLGGQITSILINVPGDPPNAATTLDGFPMSRQGRAAEALAAATLASVIGAVIGLALLLAVLPLAREVVLSFSYPEFFMVAFTGLVMVAALTRGHVFKGLISAGIGMLLAMIGLDPINASPRFAFGQLYLWDGIDIIPALIGLFAGAEMLSMFSRRGAASVVRLDNDQSQSRLWDGVVSTVRHWKTVIASSVLGFATGLIPGLGGTVASFIAYGQAARISPNPEQFGQGAVDGVIAAEAANDADRGGGLLPTIVFGIPGGTLMAVLLAGLLLHGVPIGPDLLNDDMDIVYLLVMAALIPRLIAAGLVIALSRQAILVTRMRGDVLAPIITCVAIIGVFAINGYMTDVVVLLIFSYVGYAMEKHGFSRVALIIALVLGGLLEQSFHQTEETFGVDGFFTRPISLGLFLVSMLVLFSPVIARLVRRRRAEA